VIQLITGGNGFIGSHLIDHLLTAHSADSLHTLDRDNGKASKVQGHRCDLKDAAHVKQIFAEVRPDRVYHLAGFARASGDVGVPESFENNTLTTAAILEAIASTEKPVSLFLASTAHVYGNQKESVNEASATLPTSAYGFSKMLAEQVTRRAVDKNPNLQVVIGRLNNCIGPGQGPGFVVADFTRKLRAVLAAGKHELETGPLDGRRNFMDVRDLVTLLPKLLAAPQPSRYEIYNLASSHTHTIREMVEKLIELSGKPITLKVKEATAANAFAGLDVKTDKLGQLLHPSFRALQETLKDTLEFESKGSVS